MKYAIFKAAVHILLIKNKKIFLLKRKNTGFKDGMWSVPSGRVEKDEPFTKAMEREAKEEAGIIVVKNDLSEPRFIYYNHPEGERLYIFFLCTKWQGDPNNNEPHKCKEAKWFPVSSLPQNLIPEVEIAIKSLLKNKKTLIEINFSKELF